MPIYEWLCSCCGYRFEEITPEPRVWECWRCPECQKIATIDRVITAGNFNIKGYAAKNGYSK